ncbi:MAG: class I SAM-dependent methyltransferase [Gloeobacteraceae cyanobacterium ES-bin-316]|nr:class I SAM-dependent methyltransferase [Ferruginibacter sp.]
MRTLKKIRDVIKSIPNNYYFRKEDIIFTHLTKEEKRLLFSIAKKLDDKCVVVEIGSYLGASTNFIAKGLKKNGKIYCVDTWGNHAMDYDASDTDKDERDTHAEFILNTKKYEEKIVMVRGWSHHVITTLENIIGKVDFLFIDGDHNYEGVKKDWLLYSKLLTKNGIVAFHDTGWAEGVIQVINEDVKQRSELLHDLPNMQVYIVTK